MTITGTGMSIELIPVFLYLGGKMETWQIVLVLVGVLLAILFAVGVAKWAIMWSLGMTDLIEVLLRIEEKLENISRKSSRQDSSNVDFILNSIGEDANTNHGLLQDVLTNIQKKLDDIAMNTKKQKQQGE